MGRRITAVLEAQAHQALSSNPSDFPPPCSCLVLLRTLPPPTLGWGGSSSRQNPIVPAPSAPPHTAGLAPNTSALTAQVVVLMWGCTAASLGP